MSEPITIPEWLTMLVGRLAIENEAMRQALQQPPIPEPAQDE